MAALTYTKLEEIVRGDDKIILVTITDPDTSNVVNLTGKKLWFTAKADYDSDGTDAAAVIAKDSVTGGITFLTQSGATEGQAEISIAAADTASLPAERTVLRVDVQYYAPGVGIKTAFRGELPVVPDVTVRSSV